MKLSDPETKWSFDCLTDSAGKPPAGGLVLQNLRHDGHNFAKDVRVVGLWIETEVVEASGAVFSTAKTTYYPLDSAIFTVSDIRTLAPKAISNHATGRNFNYLREADDALAFSTYFQEGGNYFGYGVSAKFEAPALLTSLANCVYSGLTVEQIFLFSRYGHVPKHEPSGGLSAARFHPMTKYAFSANPAYDQNKQFTRVSSIRFDYRLHLYLDTHYNAPTDTRLTPNQAGVFADSDSALATAGTAASWAFTHRGATNPLPAVVSAGSFDAAEKPLVLETTAPGLGKGFSVFLTTDDKPRIVRCWDNVHWWGSRGPGAPLISTPGAFHCAHLHWRWGAAAGAAPGATSDPVFNPTTWPAGAKAPQQGAWGPLVDPGIWIQTLRVAVVKNDPKLDPNRGVAPAALTKADWKSLFDPGLRSAPADIYAGEDIVLWYSAEVYGEVTLAAPDGHGPPASFSSQPKGTVFIHGIFFAHDAEKSGLAVGTTDPIHRPKTEAYIRSRKPLSWFRPAN